MKVLGIDPGSLHTGYGVIASNGNYFELVAAGCIHNASKTSSAKRYHKIYRELLRIIEQTKPDTAALENVIYCNNTRIAIKLGEARGVALLAASQAGLAIAEYAPKRIKQAVTGSGSASKIQVQHMVQQLLRLSTLPQSDTADALAAAICHINRSKIKDQRSKI